MSEKWITLILFVEILKRDRVCHLLLCCCLMIACAPRPDNVEPVPLIPGVEASNIYTVTANTEKIPVGEEISGDSIFHTAAFTITGVTWISIDVPSVIGHYSIHPLSKQVEAVAQGKNLVFTIQKPSNLLIRINDYEPLLIFATPAEQNVPDPNDPDLLYFGPGEHHVGRLVLRSNQTVYIAGGAKIIGTLEGSEVENVTIRGRGCLDGSIHTSWDKRIFGIYFERSKNITIEGIAIRNCHWWVTHFLLCENVDISHLNLYSFYRNNGGLMVDGCTGYSASDSFILTNDDCICPHALNAAGNGEPIGKDYTFKDMVLFNVISGNGIRIGASFETSRCVNWIFEDIDLLAHNPGGAAIISDHSDWAFMENLRFVDFHVEQASDRIINFFIDSTRYSCFTGYRNERGNMNQIIFANLNAPRGSISLKGYDSAHIINNVGFFNCKIGENNINSSEDITINQFVKNIYFSDDSINLPSADISSEPAFAETTTPDEMVIDNLDTGCRFVGFMYKKDRSSMNGDYHEASVPEGFSNFKAAIFEPEIEGEYEVYIHWGTFKNMATNAPWIVHHSDGYTTRYFNQNESPGWHQHGVYNFDGFSYVRLAIPGYFQITDGNVVADAVKFVRMN